VHRRGLYLFWAQVGLANEPQQQVPAAQATSAPSKSRPPSRHAEISVGFSVWRGGKWAGPQFAAGKLYDVPLLLLDPQANSTTKAVESLYSLKISTTSTSDVLVDVFRFEDYDKLTGFIEWAAGLGGSTPTGPIPYSGDMLAGLLEDPSALSSVVTPTAEHIGRAIFDGRFNALELRSTAALVNDEVQPDYLACAQASYGEDAEALLQLSGPLADLVGEPGLVPKAGALATEPIAPGQSAAIPLTFTSIGGTEQNTGALLVTAQAPFKVIGPCTDLAFDPTNYFFYSDKKRAYFVESTRY